ncbi:MAG: hypothetical protein QGG36_21175 [Pirellulaceae bacterium]|jgi:hypothetical protein|nr:hypothetical protein [Pirellulaceae bacterium]MDP7018332.1 hypothetical protein [Pirellulaceae bacterium]
MTFSPARPIAVLLLTALSAASPPLFAWQGIPDNAAVEAGREALANGPAFPWYDRQEDEVVPIRVKRHRDLAYRDSRWKRGQRQVDSGLASFFAGIFESMNLMAWFAVAAMLGAFIALLVWAFIRRQSRFSAHGQQRRTTSDAARIEQLPFQLNPAQSGDLLAEAKRCYTNGDFASAIIYLFSHQLIVLDRNQLIRLARGKTNRQYLREVRYAPGVRRLLERTMLTFEDVFFGGYSIERSQFEESWSQLDQFHDLVKESTK